MDCSPRRGCANESTRVGAPKNAREGSNQVLLFMRRQVHRKFQILRHIVGKNSKRPELRHFHLCLRSAFNKSAFANRVLLPFGQAQFKD